MAAENEQRESFPLGTQALVTLMTTGRDYFGDIFRYGYGTESKGKSPQSKKKLARIITFPYSIQKGLTLVAL